MKYAHAILAALVLGFCMVTLQAEAKKRIRYNMKEKVLYGDNYSNKRMKRDTSQNRGPASATSKPKAKGRVPGVLHKTDSPHFLQKKNKVVDCKIDNVGTSDRDEQCSVRFFEF